MTGYARKFYENSAMPFIVKNKQLLKKYVKICYNNDMFPLHTLLIDTVQIFANTFHLSSKYSHEKRSLFIKCFKRF